MSRSARGRKKGSAGKAAPRTVIVEVGSVELARGHDGLLRGWPEPVVVVAVYVVRAGQVTLAGREIVRVRPLQSCPTSVVIVPKASIRLRPRLVEGCGVVVLGFAVEHDGGDGLARAYAEVGDPSGLKVWEPETAVPAPVGLQELSRLADQPAAVNVIVRGTDLGDLCPGDDFVGASVVAVAADRRSDAEWRMRFVSGDRRNDWTAIVRVRIG